MVTAQFAISILLIIGSFVVYRQLRFMTGQSLGYNMEQMMILRKPVLSNPRTGVLWIMRMNLSMLYNSWPT